MNELKKRNFRQKEEVHQQIYDGEIKASDTVGREDILIAFNVPEVKTRQKITGRHLGTPVKWYPRKRILEVKVVGQNRNFEINQKECIYAWRTELPPESKRPKMFLMRPDMGGKMKRVKNPLYRLKLLEMTKGDRDKLEILWE